MAPALRDLILFCSALLQASLADPSPDPRPPLSSRTVRTKYGDVSGVIMTLDAKHLEPVEVFRGIPYASPPLGSLRFMPPVTGALWHGVKVADKFSPVCPQRLPDISNETAALRRMPRGRLEYLKRLLPYLREQSEDCLYLNIYAPVQDLFVEKLNVTVDFPLEKLDMSYYAADGSVPFHYDLYAISKHSGTINSGHYMAYCKHLYPNIWHEFNDCRVSSISSDSIITTTSTSNGCSSSTKPDQFANTTQSQDNTKIILDDSRKNFVSDLGINQPSLEDGHENKIAKNVKSGFRSKYSCETAFQCAVDGWKKKFRSKSNARLYFLTFEGLLDLWIEEEECKTNRQFNEKQVEERPAILLTKTPERCNRSK
ncbi:unnamed protein product [Phaedon cochleariae]|uniref:USP domain-containing protein n=1 Tax=Phaedon cochleariae TaxID=80249 RepID=A0A9N9X2R4_PHACE|nr:unnamed protein product [Phaedon cochleariae]